MDEEKIKRAYKYLLDKYPNIPSVRPEIIKSSIEYKFKLTEKEVYSAYYNWKKKVTGIKDIPKFKNVEFRKDEIKENIKWSEDIVKLKELHERYKMGEDIKDLAAEIKVSKDKLSDTFSRYKRMGVLHGKRKFRKNIVTINGKKFSLKEIKDLIERINKGEKLKDLAKELEVDVRCLSNAYYHYKRKFNEE